MRWLEDPALNPLAVEAVVPDFFRRAEFERAEKSFVDTSDLARRGASAAGINYEEISDVGRSRNECDNFRAAGCRDGVHLRARRLVIVLEVPVGCEIESRSVWRPYWLVFVELAEGDLLHGRKSARSGERCGRRPDVRVRSHVRVTTTVPAI